MATNRTDTIQAATAAPAAMVPLTAIDSSTVKMAASRADDRSSVEHPDGSEHSFLPVGRLSIAHDPTGDPSEKMKYSYFRLAPKVRPKTSSRL